MFTMVSISEIFRYPSYVKSKAISEYSTDPDGKLQLSMYEHLGW